MTAPEGDSATVISLPVTNEHAAQHSTGYLGDTSLAGLLEHRRKKASFRVV
jgi:hypothetical protein